MNRSNQMKNLHEEWLDLPPPVTPQPNEYYSSPRLPTAPRGQAIAQLYAIELPTCDMLFLPSLKDYNNHDHHHHNKIEVEIGPLVSSRIHHSSSSCCYDGDDEGEDEEYHAEQKTQEAAQAVLRQGEYDADVESCNIPDIELSDEDSLSSTSMEEDSLDNYSDVYCRSSSKINLTEDDKRLVLEWGSSYHSTTKDRSQAAATSSLNSAFQDLFLKP